MKKSLPSLQCMHSCAEHQLGRNQHKHDAVPDRILIFQNHGGVPDGVVP